jgi:hypothetical protein
VGLCRISYRRKALDTLHRLSRMYFATHTHTRHYLTSTKCHALHVCHSCSPGGRRDAANKAAAAAHGQRYSCHQGVINAADTTATVQALGLTTLRNRSALHTECVPMPGSRLDVATGAGQSAARCTGATYSPGLRPIRTCFQCQSGLVADPSLTAQSLRIDRLAVCSEWL